jgi:hypothetical protein
MASHFFGRCLIEWLRRGNAEAIAEGGQAFQGACRQRYSGS